MVQLELPHVNVLTKVDLLAEENKARPDCSAQGDVCRVAHRLPTCTAQRTWDAAGTLVL